MVVVMYFLITNVLPNGVTVVADSSSFSSKEFLCNLIGLPLV